MTGTQGKTASQVAELIDNGLPAEIALAELKARKSMRYPSRVLCGIIESEAKPESYLKALVNALIKDKHKRDVGRNVYKAFIDISESSDSNPEAKDLLDKLHAWMA